jgi:agmatinase
MIENAIHPISKADIIFLGLNYYGTCGETGKGPSLIRQALNSLSSFDFKTGKDCFDELRISDAGDIKASNFKVLRDKVLKKLAVINGTLISLGGEHLVSLPVIEALSKNQDFNVLIFDAHADFYDKYKGKKHSYATVTRRISELVSEVVISGVRDLTIEELNALSKANNVRVMDLNNLNLSKKKPWYISIDLDVLDPIFCPEVSTPVPFGPSINDLVKVLNTVCLNHRLIGIDVVELTAKKKGLSSINAGGMIMNYLKRRCK